MESVGEAGIRERLRALAAAGHPEPEGGAAAFIEAKLELLGSLDPELRDSLFYEAAAEWIGRGLVAPEAMEALARRLVSRDFLFFGIGEAEGDRVFRRTFSALILDCLLKRTLAAGGLSPEAVAAIADAMGDYATRERDLRGFVPGKGWAHAPAHAADVLASLAAAPTTDEAGCERILEAARRLLLAGGAVFAHQEDKRLARVLLAAHRRGGATRAGLAAWIGGRLAECPGSFSDMEAYARRTNLLNLLRAFYFYLRAEADGEGLAGFVEGKVRELMRIA